MFHNDSKKCSSLSTQVPTVQVETQRLILIPLTASQLRLWIDRPTELQCQLDCTCRTASLGETFWDIVRAQAEITESDPENYCFHSFWFLVRKCDRVVVGSADFKDLPDAEQTVEIGYGLEPEFEHQGYMTETVDAMCTWALNRTDIRRVIAETDSDGFASQRILKRCGFHRFERPSNQEDTIWWAREKD